MKLIDKTVLEPLLSLKKPPRGGAFGRKYSSDELPLRSELLSSDQMKQHGKTLANMHKLTSERVSEQLLARLNENEDVLIETCNQLTSVVKDNSPIAPAEEWLLDNFYLIEEHIRMTKRHLPKGYSRGLPRLLNGPSAGLPRVYDIALETISHGDGRVDLESLISFVTAYQTVTNLKLGELWAIPIMLRLALIENLRRIGTRIIAGIADRARAGYWADQMADIAQKDPKNLVLVIADMARSDQPMASSFVAEFARRLQGQSPALALPLTWIEQRLSESHLTIEQLVRSENQQQVADQVSVSNSIGSLRFLTGMNWREFVETMSVVEQILREDPSDIYIKMDFTTRDLYRHVVEKIAKNSPISESEVARFAIDLSREGSSKSSNDDRVTHVGFYLIDKGLPELEKRAQMRQPVSEFIHRIISRFPLFIYLTTIMVITLISAGGLLLKVQTDGLHGWILVPISIIFILGASSLAVVLTNWLATLLAHPHPLPRMDFSLEIPPESSTLVVIPTMLTSAQNVEDLVESLEIRFLANRDNNLHFGLLTDFSDAHEETTSEDDAILRLARKRIGELNDKYRGAKGGTFFLFHRPRRWNPEEQIWMGYERKRGKIAELNALLRGGAKDCFSLIVGTTEILSNVKYIITLDTDTQLPRDSAQQFVGAMAHPLNRPRYDESQQRICDGYGILQPRLAESLSGNSNSRYARLWGGETGIDPYTRVVSNIYQDVFGEGSYIGKGIYDVDAFEKALSGRLPENRILSHDLIEGCYVRSGLFSDVQLYEEYPSQYNMDVSRRHRWIRGDWQIASWLRSVVPVFGGGHQKNKISWLSQWKIFDNLRRSLVPAALTLMLIMGWTIMSPVWLWTIMVIGILLIPSAGVILLELLRKPGDVLLSQHFVTALRQAQRHFFQTLYTFVCLPYEAFFSLDAIARTLWRMLVTHKRLLEWNPSGNQMSHSSNNFAASCRSMWIAPLLSAVLFIYLTMSKPGALSAALFVLVLWFLSPSITWWVSRPIVRGGIKLKDGQIIFLRKIARKTWAFFETFVGPDDNWLPPDNYQEHPVTVISHRTSPTNMGLALLANLSAYDFGYISAGELIERTNNAFHTMGKMERYRGHFYNWYDTQSLATLRPHYISTVDSGNLSGHLLTLRRGFIDLPDQKIWGSQLFQGINDTTTCLMEVAGVTALKQLAGFQKYLASLTDPGKMMLKPLRQCLDHLAKSSIDLAGAFNANTESHIMRWVKALVHQCADALEEMTFFCPWLTLKYPSARLSEFFETMEIPTLRKLTISEMELLQVIENIISINTIAEEAAWYADFRRMVKEGSQRAGERIAAINRLVAQANDFADMDYSFLYDKGRQLLTIGYSTTERRRDASYYDLLASEARFCSFIGIAQGQLPQENWFALGRLLTNPGRYPVLLSWDGSMFEYLMPLLVMPNYENTLLDQTYTAAVCRQIDYGKNRGVPWGISESGYSTIDVHLNYQYRGFGVPGLGLKRGLFDDLVVAPYASALALMVAPEEACLNLQQLARDGMEGPYGFYEAIDYTSSRLPRGQSSVVVRSFMAHHEGMSLLALAYLLLDCPMQKRFESDPMFQSTMLLLQERIPRAVAFYRQIAEDITIRKASLSHKIPARIFKTPNTPVPEVQLLSNGRYHVMITNAGGGYSRFQDMAVTRWREDSTRDNWGTFCYIRDVISGEFWSTAYQPTLKRPERYEAIFSDAKVEFRRRDNEINTHTEIAVSPEDDIELRRIRITNRSRRLPREIDITSYAEIVLAVPAADALHPAFSNLFVQTEIIRERQTILCTRRPRSKGEPAHWMFHLMALHGTESKEVSYETDRLKFIGRGNTLANPQAMNWSADISETLSDTEGSVLDPIVAIRCRVKLDAGESVTIDIVSGISETRDKALGLAEKYHDRRLADRVFDMAWTHSQVVLRQINATEADAQLYGRLAGSVIYSNSSLRADPKIIIKNRRGQSGLWGYAISGDLPIVLLQIGDHANIELVRQLEQAHAYWRLKGLAVDLVIWNEDNAIYRQFLNDQIKGMITAGTEAKVIDKPGGIFVRPGDQISNEDRILLQTVARIVIKDNWGTLAEQISHRSLVEAVVPRFKPTRAQHAEIRKTKEITHPNLIFFNGLGGFTPDGREYVITTKPGSVTPAPWVNVLANPHFGSVISESGSASTWSENAHEFRLTPWCNDPVSDISGEAFYIRDEETGHFWSPTPLPCRAATPYISRHGFGYSVFEHMEEGIRSELWIYVAIDAPIKFTVLKLHNESGRSRSLSVTGYVEWVLGDLRSKTMMHVTTEVDTGSGALFARNQYNTEFADWLVFFDVDDINRIITGDRTEFIGRNGELSSPAAMTRTQLSGKVGAALDPCAAIQVNFELDDGQEHETIFRLGVTGRRGADDASNTVRCFRGSTIAQSVLDAVQKYWKKTLGTIQVETPDQSLNVLTNGWLLYQTLSCRLWARNGYYQSGGAFGFRDQLQDIMALVYTQPVLVRQHLLLCASRQFQDGDVQHWWHPPSGRGVRTQCSDDYLWLPLAVSRYIITTSDLSILNEIVRFIEGRQIRAEEDSYYDLPGLTDEATSLYDHCARAIKKGLRFGSHGLPLIGSGDWNDGMNKVGEGGKGESVWMGFFLYEVLMQFAEIALLKSDMSFAELCKKEAVQLQRSIEHDGWDGQWYRRAYFDDGSPLGSVTNTECRIDSIAQSWSVLSGAGAPERMRQAMEAVDRLLVHRDQKLIQLLDPPFDKSEMEPGYIKGYVPGVRENGGQYTHAAIWAAMAFAALRDNQRLWDLLSIINPINHARSPEEADIYKVEPYVVTSDVYALFPHVGRGGWTWFTGSAAWMYRLILESLLGMSMSMDKITFEPCLPSDWKEFKIRYLFRETVYRITVQQTDDGVKEVSVTIDGFVKQDRAIQLVNDHQEHLVEVRIPAASM